MYNQMLDTFITVVDCGSFTKASEQLYISSTAVMKQMNTLENHLNLKLINRTNSGISLTAAGKIIYDEAKYMIDYSKKTIQKAKNANIKYDTTFCIGTSLLNPAKTFMDLWYQLNHQFPNYKLHLVPFEDNHEGILSEIRKLGEKFDFLIGVCDSKAYLSLCNFLPLGKYKKMIAVSREHPLALKKIINIEDLYGETLMMVKKGDSELNDHIRHDLETNHPNIVIEDTAHFYDLSVFNRCAETKNVLLTIECWKEVHPGLITIPVNWDYSIPYRLLYSKNAPEDVIKFVEAVDNLIKNRIKK
ncbi:MAG: LysR family transcriptional regulator [Anaeroplasmataceae bacterium]